MGAKKAYVVPTNGREAELEALKALIQTCANLICDSEPISAFGRCVEEADVIVILICEETAENDLIEEIIALANRLGRRIVGVWTVGASSSQLSRGLSRYGDAAIRLDAEEVASAICADETPWNSADGLPRDPPPTPRHKKR